MGRLTKRARGGGGEVDKERVMTDPGEGPSDCKRILRKLLPNEEEEASDEIMVTEVDDWKINEELHLVAYKKAWTKRIEVKNQELVVCQSQLQQAHQDKEKVEEAIKKNEEDKEKVQLDLIRSIQAIPTYKEFDKMPVDTNINTKIFKSRNQQMQDLQQKFLEHVMLHKKLKQKHQKIKDLWWSYGRKRNNSVLPSLKKMALLHKMIEEEAVCNICTDVPSHFVMFCSKGHHGCHKCWVDLRASTNKCPFCQGALFLEEMRWVIYLSLPQ